jgi:hypothetical protein
VHRREADGPYSIWQADLTPLDILLIRPDGEPTKPWLTSVIDDYSLAVPGYFLSFDALFRRFLLDPYHRRECSETKAAPV